VKLNRNPNQKHQMFVSLALIMPCDLQRSDGILLGNASVNNEAGTTKCLGVCRHLRGKRPGFTPVKTEYSVIYSAGF
jgi:hypothetical protein